MPIPTDRAGLIAAFTLLGERNPEAWADSELSEGIPQLLRRTFLHQAWSRINGNGDTAPVDAHIAASENYPDGPYAGLGASLARCLAAGASKSDLAEIVRCIQAQTLFDVCYLIDGPALFNGGPTDDVDWGLFEIDHEGNPKHPRIDGLHEDVLSTDPTQREMRPRKED